MNTERIAIVSKTTCILGIGLIGGSLALSLRNKGFARQIIGVDSSKEHRNLALLHGLVDQILELDQAIDQSDVILLCAPVSVNSRLLPHILDRVKGTSKVVADMGSTKADIIGTVKNHPLRGRYVAVHPMAGTEYSGPLAAKDKLFDNKLAIICDSQNSDEDAMNLISGMLTTLGMGISLMNSAEHDIHVAYVSHLSHISSFALALSVLDKEKDEKNILSLAAGGFESTVRLAKSNSATWAPIFLQNAKPLLEVIDNYIEKVMLFRQYIMMNDPDSLLDLMKEANKIEKILDQNKHKSTTTAYIVSPLN
ncbi:MAG: prephenate dehydrogenase [Bacteroidetes bacterium]|nr:prephenate dehydrogenase [Bacteroidota bacterium]